MAETVHRIHSVQLGNERTVWIRSPAASGPSNYAPRLIILLDAEFYRERMDLPALLDSFASEHAFASAWFVFVSMESLAARWVECPCHPPFARFITEELLPWISSLHPSLAAAERTLAGLSYTGLAAAYVALENPGVFTRVIAQSGSFWWNDCWLSAHVAECRMPPATAFYLEVGRRETATHVAHRPDVLQIASQIEGVDRFEAALRTTGHTVLRSDFDGGHDFAAWKQTIPAALRWALTAPPPSTTGGF